MGDEFKIELSRAKANLDSLNSGANPQIRLDSSVKKFDFLKAVKN